jgi:hypothetical protein
MVAEHQLTFGPFQLDLAQGRLWPGTTVVGVRPRSPSLPLAAMGDHAGLSQPSRSLAECAVAFIFSVVIGLMADLDRLQEGVLKVSQQALIDLRPSMQGPDRGSCYRP